MKRTLWLLLIASLAASSVSAGPIDISGPSASDAGGAYGSALTSAVSTPAPQQRYSAKSGADAPIPHFTPLNFKPPKARERAEPVFAALASRGIQPHELAAMDE